MNTSVFKEVAAIRDLLKASEFRRALQLIESVKTASSDPETFAEYICLYSEVLYLNGDYRRALEASTDCLDKMASVGSKEYGLQKHMHAKILQHLGRAKEAIEAFTESYVLLQKLNLYSEALFPLDSLASLHYVRGDYPATVRALNQQIEIRRAHGLLKDLPRCQINKGRVLLRMGDMLRAAPYIFGGGPPPCE